MKYRKILIVLVLSIVFVTGCGSDSSSSDSTGPKNRCGDTTSQHYAKERACNAKDTSTQNCSYSNCTCTCRHR